MRLFLILLSLLPTIALAGYTPAYTIVSDKQHFDIEKDGSYVQTFERRIRIETPQGIDQYGQGKISYDGRRDQVQIVEAYTIAPNGDKLIVSPDRIKRISANTDESAPYFTDQMLLVIIFPQVEVGSQLHFKIIREQHEAVIKDRFADITAYSPHRQYEQSELSYSYPNNMGMKTYSRGVEGRKTELGNGRERYDYKFQQINVYPTEPGEVEYEDFAPVVQVSNFNGFGDLARITQGLFQPKTQVTPNIQLAADRIIRGATTNREKASKIYQWVSKNVRYVGIDVGASGYEPHYADEILENLYGDCKDHATILEALLLAAGIPSSPALIKTAQSYHLPNLAGNYYFDHVITYIPMFDLYLDSTAQFAEFGTLPMDDMGKPTLITTTGDIGATPKSSSSRDQTYTRTKLQLLNDGSIVGTSEYTPQGYFTTNSRSAQFSYENRDTQVVVDSLLKRYLESGSGSLSHGDPNDLHNKWVVKSSFKLDPVINVPGASAFSIPNGLAPGFIRLHAGLKLYQGRRYPYGCGSSSHTEHIELVFPSEIKVNRIPKSVFVSVGSSTYHSKYKLEGNKLIAHRVWRGEEPSDECVPTPSKFLDAKKIRAKVREDLREQIFIE